MWWAGEHSKAFKDVFAQYTPTNQKRMMRMLANTVTALRDGTIEAVAKSEHFPLLYILRKADSPPSGYSAVPRSHRGGYRKQLKGGWV